MLTTTQRLAACLRCTAVTSPEFSAFVPAQTKVAGSPSVKYLRWSETSAPVVTAALLYGTARPRTGDLFTEPRCRRVRAAVRSGQRGRTDHLVRPEHPHVHACAGACGAGGAARCGRARCRRRHLLGRRRDLGDRHRTGAVGPARDSLPRGDRHSRPSRIPDRSRYRLRHVRQLGRGRGRVVQQPEGLRGGDQDDEARGRPEQHPLRVDRRGGRAAQADHRRGVHGPARRSGHGRVRRQRRRLRPRRCELQPQADAEDRGPTL